ncbi:hypothetical protein Nepgr_010438 [Nepenthes gracilis]|uniref:Uncharacterized protein n=1 Tax=Nepenthes gracilis TaxID=150966 RepID=A0AAD3SCB2_NEPGR|nr:hypothetical protein Nepgr_010438 [Nepenthes gracilis]
MLSALLMLYAGMGVLTVWAILPDPDICSPEWAIYWKLQSWCSSWYTANGRRLSAGVLLPTGIPGDLMHSRTSRFLISETRKADLPSTGDVSKDDGALFVSMIDELANVVTNTDHPVLDVGAPFVADHAAGSPHRPLKTLDYVPFEDGSKGAHQPSFDGLDAVSSHYNQTDGSNGSNEFGFIPGVDGSTPESIARIARKYSQVDVVDGLLNKAPSEFQDVSSIPLSGCPVKGSRLQWVKQRRIFVTWGVDWSTL